VVPEVCISQPNSRLRSHIDIASTIQGMQARLETVTSRAVPEQVSRSLYHPLISSTSNETPIAFSQDPTLNPSYMSNDPESGVGSSAAGYSTTGGFGSEGMGSTNGTGPGSAGSNVWESRLGLRIDVLAALAYLGGPLAGERWTSRWHGSH
jgi:hypothetical protein